MTITWLIIGGVFAIVNRFNKSKEEKFEDRDN